VLKEGFPARDNLQVQASVLQQAQTGGGPQLPLRLQKVINRELNQAEPLNNKVKNREDLIFAKLETFLFFFCNH